MREHQWKADKDGAECCTREGCTIRRGVMGKTWQRKKGAHWRYVAPAFGQAQPIPPCAGAVALVHCPKCQKAWTPEDFGKPKCCGPSGCNMNKPAPSPLEVVHEALANLVRLLPAEKRVAERERALTALAALEESIRADERAKVAEYLRGRKDAALGFGHTKRAEAFADAAEEVDNLGTK